MEYKHTVEILHNQVQEIATLIGNFEKTGNIHLIELDIIMEKFRNIYDLTLELRSAIERDQAGKVVQEKIPEMKLPAETLIDEPFTGSIKETVVKKTEKEPLSDVDQKLSREESKILSDRFRTSQHTLNDEISGKSSLGSIKGGLSLNEKFELINHLFKGNKEKFEHTMGVLDMAGSFVEACNYIESHFNWDMNDPSVQRILELIRRKLIVRRNGQ